jgi:hypothetical protein
LVRTVLRKTDNKMRKMGMKARRVMIRADMVGKRATRELQQLFIYTKQERRGPLVVRRKAKEGRVPAEIVCGESYSVVESVMIGAW